MKCLNFDVHTKITPHLCVRTWDFILEYKTYILIFTLVQKTPLAPTCKSYSTTHMNNIVDDPPKKKKPSFNIRILLYQYFNDMYHGTPTNFTILSSPHQQYLVSLKDLNQFRKVYLHDISTSLNFSWQWNQDDKLGVLTLKISYSYLVGTLKRS